MNIWITKNIRFGFRYTINKSIRNNINSCLNEWLNDLLSKRLKDDDIFVIYGGLFSNTNPSLIAINDAHIFLKKLSEKIKIYLINTDKDIKIYEDESYSTLKIFSDIPNVYIINDIKLINQDIVINNDLIPNLMQLDETETKSGILVYNLPSNKHVIIENTFSPKHITYIINSMEDFEKINKNLHKNDFIHVQINNNLLEQNKLEVNITLHNLNPCSVKSIDTTKIQQNKIINVDKPLNIIDTIYKFIDNDEELKSQFQRVLNIYNNK